MKHMERKLLTAFLEEACVKGTCTYHQWVQFAINVSKGILNTTWMLTTIVEWMRSKLSWYGLYISMNGEGLRIQPAHAGAAKTRASQQYEQLMFNPATFDHKHLLDAEQFVLKDTAVGCAMS